MCWARRGSFLFPRPRKKNDYGLPSSGSRENRATKVAAGLWTPIGNRGESVSVIRFVMRQKDGKENGGQKFGPKGRPSLSTLFIAGTRKGGLPTRGAVLFMRKGVEGKEPARAGRNSRTEGNKGCPLAPCSPKEREGGEKAYSIPVKGKRKTSTVKSEPCPLPRSGETKSPLSFCHP